MGRPPLKKAAIERAALELFVEKGVDGTSIRDIAERAGVTEGALYRHHKSKDDLVRALFFEHYAEFAKLIAQIQQSSQRFRDMIPRLVDAFFRFYDDDPHIFQFVILVRHRLLDEVRKDDRNPVELLNRIIERAAEQGEIHTDDTALTTQMILGMVLQTAIAERYGRITGPLTKYTDTVAQHCIMVAGFVEGHRMAV